MGNEIAIGSCNGTGAAINVILGWIPDHVRIMNLGDGGTKYAEVEWYREMALVSALDEGMLLKGVDDTDMDRTPLTTAGISAYAGGDEIFYDEAQTRWEDIDGNDKTEVYVNGHHRNFVSGSDAFQDYGFEAASTTTPVDGDKFTMPEGFTVGTNADLNVDGEQLVWMATKTRE